MTNDKYYKEWFKMTSADPINEAPIFRTRTNNLILIIGTVNNMKLGTNTLRILNKTFKD